jgi:hypothetical protein
VERSRRRGKGGIVLPAGAILPEVPWFLEPSTHVQRQHAVHGTCLQYDSRKDNDQPRSRIAGLLAFWCRRKACMNFHATRNFLVLFCIAPERIRDFPLSKLFSAPWRWKLQPWACDLRLPALNQEHKYNLQKQTSPVDVGSRTQDGGYSSQWIS